MGGWQGGQTVEWEGGRLETLRLQRVHMATDSVQAVQRAGKGQKGEQTERRGYADDA